MALIKCSECGKEVSDKALLCPHCGMLVAKENDYDEKRNTDFGKVLISTRDTIDTSDIKKPVGAIVFWTLFFILSIFTWVITEKDMLAFPMIFSITMLIVVLSNTSRTTNNTVNSYITLFNEYITGFSYPQNGGVGGNFTIRYEDVTSVEIQGIFVVVYFSGGCVKAQAKGMEEKIQQIILVKKNAKR